MATEHPRLKLGKRAAFVKTRLKLLPQEKESWEADFRALPKPRGQSDTYYLGVVVARPHGDPLVYLPVEYTPNVNDLADLLADAMRRPLTGSARRPAHIHFRGNPRWEELFRHLNDLGVETSVHHELPKVEEAHEDFLRQMRKASPGPIIMLAPVVVRRRRSPPSGSGWTASTVTSRSATKKGSGLSPGRSTTAGWCSRTTSPGRSPRRWPLWTWGWQRGSRFKESRSAVLAVREHDFSDDRMFGKVLSHLPQEVWHRPLDVPVVGPLAAVQLVANLARGVATFGREVQDFTVSLDVRQQAVVKQTLDRFVQLYGRFATADAPELNAVDNHLECAVDLTRIQVAVARFGESGENLDFSDRGVQYNLLRLCLRVVMVMAVP